MNFPALPLSQKNVPKELLSILNIELVASIWAKNRFLIEVSSKEVLLGISPDFSAWNDYPNVIVTCRSNDEEYDFYSRFFAPASGIPEDPVTGSAHCALGPYWAKKLGRKSLKAFQLSARGGGMSLRVEGDRVFIRFKMQLDSL